MPPSTKNSSKRQRGTRNAERANAERGTRNAERANAPALTAISYALGRTRKTIDDLVRARRVTSPPAALRDLGFRAVYVAEGETAYDLAKRAVAKLLRSGRPNPEDVDLLLYATALPQPAPRSREPLAQFDYPATRLQHDFGMTRANVAGVAQAGCVALFSAIRMARGVLAAEPDLRRVLCVATDVLPRASRREILFNLISDGACAALIERGGARNRILSYAQATKGFYWSPKEREHQLIATYFPTARRVIEEALARAATSIDEIALVIPHNVNETSWRLLLDLLGVPARKLYRRNIASKGHTIAADPLINLADAAARGAIHPGDRLLLFTFGFGAHWAAMVVEH